MTTEQIKIVDRIRKLLALSRSANEHEAANAAARASALMAEHEIEEAELRIDDPGRTAAPIGSEGVLKGRSTWKGQIALALASSAGGYVFWDGPTLRMFGRRDGVRGVSYMLAYLCREVERLSDEAWQVARALPFQRETARSWKAGFRLGASVRIAGRIRTETEARDAFHAVVAMSPRSMALALVNRDRDEVDGAWNEYRKQTRMGKARRPSASSPDGFRAGTEAGDQVQIAGGKALRAAQAQIRGK